MESDPILSPDASGAPVPTDRWAVAASKRRLVACLASVSLLACFSTTMLLRWPHEMKTAFEAKADLVLLPDSNTTAALDSSASGTLDSSTHEAWTTIRWARHPTKCIDVAGDNSGAQLQVWTCSELFPKKQRFILPPLHSTGEIKWATNPDLCLDNPEGSVIQLWMCALTPRNNKMFKVSPDGQGRIHLASLSGKCLDVPSGITDNGWKLQLWDCDDVTQRGREDNIGFVIRKRVDCTWGSWSTWSACPVTCGGGSHLRSRQVEVNASEGGRTCEDSDRMEMGSCGSQPCKAEAVDSTSAGDFTLTTTSLDPSYKYLTTSRRKVVERSATSRASLRVAVLLVSLPLAIYSYSIK